MNLTRIVVTLVLSLAMAPNGAPAQNAAATPFSLDSAASYLRVLAEEIGPRTMGSPAERRAMEFSLAKFRSFGLDEAYLLPMTTTTSSSGRSLTITSSGTAVGVLRGANERIIVLGAHIDSAAPEIPGANDDGSGCAVVLELARVLAQRQNQSTIVFALFGGEEQGLRGSRHFVGHFADIDKVVLMLQVDMANGSGWLLPLLSAGQKKSPEWLVRSAYEELRDLGYSGLSYPTHFMSFVGGMPGGGIGSDHMPFLERDIPAIDFTTDINDPIHTQQDTYAAFSLWGLKRSGDLVYRLVERFDGGVPEQKTGSYFLWELLGVPFFFPIWSLVAFAAAAVVLAVAVLLSLRKKRIIESPHRTVPGLKLFLIMLIIQTCVWLSPTLAGMMIGSTIPWYADLDGIVILGFVAATFGIWIGLQLTRRLGLTRDAYRYALRTFVWLIVFVVGMALLMPELALYPASALLVLALARLVRPTWLRLLLWVASPYFMTRLFFSEGFPLLARSLAEAPVEGFLQKFILHLVPILLFSVWLFPFLLGFAAVYVSLNSDPLRLSSFRKGWGALASAGSFIVGVLYLSTIPVYTESWRQKIRIEQEFDLSRGTGTVQARSADYLDGLRVRFPDRDTLIHGNTLTARLMEDVPPPERFLVIDRTVEPSEPGRSALNLLLTLRMKYRPYTLRVSYTARRGSELKASSVLPLSSDGKGATFRWYSFPDTLLVVPVTLEGGKTDTLWEHIEADFIEPVVPLQGEKEFAEVAYRTRLRSSQILPVRRQP